VSSEKSFARSPHLDSSLVTRCFSFFPSSLDTYTRSFFIVPIELVKIPIISSNSFVRS
jgi:hypothetical protein